MEFQNLPFLSWLEFAILGEISEFMSRKKRHNLWFSDFSTLCNFSQIYQLFLYNFFPGGSWTVGRHVVHAEETIAEGGFGVVFLVKV